MFEDMSVTTEELDTTVEAVKSMAIKLDLGSMKEVNLHLLKSNVEMVSD